MPMQEMQHENIQSERNTDWMIGQTEPEKKMADEHDDVQPTVEHEIQGELQPPPPRTAISDATALHALLTDLPSRRLSTDATGAIPATVTVIKPTTGVSQGRRSSIGRVPLGKDKNRRSSIEPTTENTVEIGVNVSQGRRSSISRRLIVDEADKPRRMSVDQDDRIKDEEIAVILCARTKAERSDIARAYLSLFGEDLVTELRHQLSGEFGHLIQALMENPILFDAHQLHQAVDTVSTFTGLCTKNSTLIEILCTRSNDEIRRIKSEYRQMFGTYLENDVSKVTWNHLMHLFMWLNAATREESTDVDREKACQDAMLLCAADETHFARNSDLFAFILATQSTSQLLAVFDEYHRIAGIDIEKAIEREFSGDFRNALLAIVMNVTNQLPTYFAHRLHKALHGIGSHDTTLIRLIVTRYEIDMAAIRNEYERIYHKTLVHDVTSYCSGSFREGLLQLIHLC